MADEFDAPWSGVGVGGSLALDFVNTLDWRLCEPPVELLKTFSDLLRWARTGEVFDAQEARALRSWADAHPRVAARFLTEAIDVREAMASAFGAMVHGDQLPAASLDRLDAACRDAWAARSLRSARAGAVWDWRTASPDRPMLASALDAARILTSNERERIRQCGDAKCGWYFLDTSRNGSRRWCTMEGCGNRNKARRFYRRQRSS